MWSLIMFELNRTWLKNGLIGSNNIQIKFQKRGVLLPKRDFLHWFTANALERYLFLQKILIELWKLCETSFGRK